MFITSRVIIIIINVVIIISKYKGATFSDCYTGITW